MKHGEGCYRWQSGDIYSGRFVEDKREGVGVYTWNDGGVYRGEWKADRMNGIGRLVKGGIDIVGEFFADHFVKVVE